MSEFESNVTLFKRLDIKANECNSYCIEPRRTITLPSSFNVNFLNLVFYLVLSRFYFADLSVYVIFLAVVARRVVKKHPTLVLASPLPLHPLVEKVQEGEKIEIICLLFFERSAQYSNCSKLFIRLICCSA